MSRFYLSRQQPRVELFQNDPDGVWYQTTQKNKQSLVFELLDFFERVENQGMLMHARVFENDEDLKWVLKQVQERIYRMLGSYQDSLKGLRLLFKNLPHIQEGKDIHEYYTPHKTAIYIAAGPSADVPQDIERLRKIADSNEALIVCCDIMLDWCINHGIIPKIVVTAERDDEIADTIANKPKNTMLVCTEVSPTRMLENAGEDLAFILRSSGAVRWVAGELNYEVVGCGVSVSPTTMAVLNAIGIKNVWLYGFDCGFPVDTRSTHCEYNFQKLEFFEEYSKPLSDEMMKEQRLFETKGNEGQQVQTNALWQHYGALVARFGLEHGMKLINCSRLGAEVPACEYKTLDQFEPSICEGPTLVHRPGEVEQKNFDKFLWDEADHIYSLLQEPYEFWSERTPAWLSEDPVLKDVALNLLLKDRFIYYSRVYEGSMPESTICAEFGTKVRSAVQDIYLVLQEYLSREQAD